MQAQRAQGDDMAAAVTSKLFGMAWTGSAPPDLARL
jgi:hypothetical protein